jgi:AcrR family transcriptional regulator
MSTPVKTTAATLAEAPTSPARRRLLDTATRLFYAEGIRAVGIDRIIAEAGIAKATFYHHFPSKDDLVLAYIEDQDRIGREAVASFPRQPPRKMIAAIVGRISTAAGAGDFRGCPFLNAAAEYPDSNSQVRRAIDARRVWYQEVLRQLLVADGDPTPSVTASLLVALSDGLLEYAYLDDPRSVPSLIQEGLTRLLDRRAVSADRHQHAS